MLNNFSVSHVIRHPFFLVTFAIAIPAWIIAFAGQAAAEAQYNNAVVSIPTTTHPDVVTRGLEFSRRAVAIGNISTAHAPVVKYLWYNIWIQLAIIIHLFLATCTDALAVHRFQIAVLLAVAEVFGVYGTEFLFYNAGALIATGVGWLLLTMVDLVWILYLTAEEDTLIYRVLNAGGNGGLSGNSRSGQRMGVASTFRAENGYSGANNAPAGTGYGGTTTRLNGGTYSMGGPNASGYTTANDTAATKVASPHEDFADLNGGDHNAQPLKQRARAMYAYNASADDPNEVSFAKGDILEVLDNTGKWFQVRTTAGHTGIAPSNYLTML